MEIMNNSKVRLGIMGCGEIAHAMAKAALYTPNVELYAVASRSYKKALSFNEAYGAKEIYGSYEALVLDKYVDLIYIATPHGLHHEHIKLCLDHDKHVLCEKAFTLNADLARPLFKLAKEKNLFLMEAMWTRFIPSTHMIQDLLTSHVLGDIKHVTIDFGVKMKYDEASRLWDPYLGGGALLDIGIYPMSMMHLLFGKPNKMHSSVEFASNGVDKKTHITLYYDTFQATIRVSFEDDLEPNALMIEGSQEILISERFWMSQEVVLKGANKVFQMPFEMNGYEYELYESALMIQSKTPEHPLMTHEMTLEMLMLMDEIRHSWGLKYPIETLKG
jgi:predicted dehydrogenase